MADHSAIEWTDATWNPITGCAVTWLGGALLAGVTLAALYGAAVLAGWSGTG